MKLKDRQFCDLSYVILEFHLDCNWVQIIAEPECWNTTSKVAVQVKTSANFLNEILTVDTNINKTLNQHYLLKLH